jgi:2-polyprenyl-6-methoxyphenol hydroxylase-like FAD-dependent oxidoreductase
MTERADVGIVGGGPVGQVLAILLGQRGHTVRVFERWPGPYPLPRACGLGDEPVRILQSIGLGERFAALSDPVLGETCNYQYTNQNGDTLLEFFWTELGAQGWPHMSTFFQPDLEDAIAGALAALPAVQLERGAEVAAVQQDADSARMILAGDPRRVVEARYVIGADGANSLVREAIGATVDDLGFAFDWLVVDTVPHDVDRRWDPYLEQRCDPARPTTAVPSGPGRRRWEFMRLPGESIDELNTEARAWELLEPWGITPANAMLVRHAVYTFRGSWAQPWRDGRLLLAGDAAHLMPPFLGQGLGSGLRDAAALAWRLDLVLRGRCDDILLDSYTPERLGHVRQVIEESVGLGRVICVEDPEQAAERDRGMLAARADPSLAPPPPPPWRLGPGLWNADDPLGGLLAVQGEVEHEGRRGLMDDLLGTGFLLLAPGGDPQEALGEDRRERWARIDGRSAHVAPGAEVDDVAGTYAAWFKANGIGVALVRPDFYIFGTAPTLAGADALVARLLDALPRADAPAR